MLLDRNSKDVFARENIVIIDDPPVEYKKAIKKCSDENPPIRSPLQSMQFAKYEDGTIYVTFDKVRLMHMKVLERKQALLDTYLSEAFGKPMSIKLMLAQDYFGSGSNGDVNNYDDEEYDDIPKEYTRAIKRCSEIYPSLNTALSKMEYFGYDGLYLYIRFPDRNLKYLMVLEGKIFDLEDIFEEEYDDFVELKYDMQHSILQKVIDSCFDIFGREVILTDSGDLESLPNRRGAKEAIAIIPALQRMEYIQYKNGVVSAAFAKRNEKYLNELLNKKDYIESLFSEAFGEPVTLSISLKDPKHRKKNDV